MTANTSNPNQNEKLKPQPNQDRKAPENTKKASSAGTQTAADISTETAKPQMKKVDIVIAGVTYQIYCPVNEEAELRSAVYYINNFALNIKKDAPSLSQENLLVLCCLNLYEKIHANDKTNDANKKQSQQTAALLNKIMKDAESIL